MELTLVRLRHLLDYNPLTGEWTWVNPLAYNVFPNDKAGWRRSDGYLQIRIRGRRYYSSRLAWFYMTGEWPTAEMDHIDRDPANDKWDNLREATSSQNKYNRNDDGNLRGVYRSGNSRWWAMSGRNAYLGTFDTLEEAIQARDASAKELGGDFAILNSVTGNGT